jgi:hypothetical protein
MTTSRNFSDWVSKPCPERHDRHGPVHVNALIPHCYGGRHHRGAKQGGQRKTEKESRMKTRTRVWVHSERGQQNKKRALLTEYFFTEISLMKECLCAEKSLLTACFVLKYPYWLNICVLKYPY